MIHVQKEHDIVMGVHLLGDVCIMKACAGPDCAIGNVALQASSEKGVPFQKKPGPTPDGQLLHMFHRKMCGCSNWWQVIRKGPAQSN